MITQVKVDIKIYVFAVFYPLTMTVLKGQTIFTTRLKKRKEKKRNKKSKRTESERRVENNRSDEHKVHKLKMISDYGNKKPYQYHYRFNDLPIICL